MSAPLGPLFEARAQTGCAVLRALLRDGRWHTQQELAEAVGYRYGAVIHRVRRGEDGLPALLVEKRRESADGAKWSYRQVGKASDAAPPAEGLREKVRRLERENVELRGRLYAAEHRLRRLTEEDTCACGHPRHTHWDFHHKPRSCASCACLDFVKELCPWPGSSQALGEDV